MNIRVKLQIPEAILDVQKVRDSIEQAQNTVTGPKVQALFRKTVVGWHGAPNFTKKRHVTRNQIGIIVHPTGDNTDKYTLVNEGARKHIIRPKRARLLRFQRGYYASTRPRVIGSRANRRFGAIVATPLVHHPGFVGREFDAAIADEHTPQFVHDMQSAIKRGVS